MLLIYWYSYVYYKIEDQDKRNLIVKKDLKSHKHVKKNETFVQQFHDKTLDKIAEISRPLITENIVSSLDLMELF